MTIKPWTFFLVAVAGWMNRQQQEVITYLREENRILREKIGKKRVFPRRTPSKAFGQLTPAYRRALKVGVGARSGPATDCS